MKINLFPPHIHQSFFRNFLLFLAVLWTVVSFYFLYRMEQAADQISRSTTDSAKEQILPLEQMLASELYNMSEIAKSIETYQDVRPFYLQHFPSKASSLIHTLNSYFTNNNIVDEIYMHFFCDEYFYSTKTSYSARSFLNLFNLSYGQGQTGEQFLERIRAAESAKNAFFLYGLSPRQSASQPDQDRAVLYVYPYHVDDIAVGALIFQINEANLNAWIGNRSGQDTYIFNQALDFMNADSLDSSILDDFTSDQIRDMMNAAASGATESIVKDKYQILYGSVENTGLYYLRFVKNQILPSIVEKLFFFCCLLFMALLVLAAAAYCLLAKPFLTKSRALKQAYDILSSDCAEAKRQLEAANRQEEEAGSLKALPSDIPATDEVVPCAPPMNLASILSFIEENYCSENFSLQLLADHFGVSLSYLSLFFKERYGENLLNYYTGLRMEKAKELLDTTDLPLKDIVAAVGYSNVSSFIRRFKQLYGVTPRRYAGKSGQ